MKKTYRAKTLFVALALLTFGPVGVAHAVTIFEHSGNSDPTSEGWAQQGPLSGGITAGPITNDLGSGINAWFVDDNSTDVGSALQYQAFPTLTQAADAITRGWQLTANLRVVDVPDNVDFSVSFEYLDGTRRYGLEFGSQADGDPIVQFLGGASVALEGAGGGYHLYGLHFDPSAGSADLFVDGVERISNFGGFAESQSPEVAWGGRQSASTGHGNYNLIRFEIAQVPEPSIVWLLGVGVAYKCRFLKKTVTRHGAAVS